MKRVLIIGAGSIGSRHGRVLASLGFEIAFVSRRALGGVRAYDSIGQGVARHPPDYVVVADETARHRESLQAIRAAGYSGPVLVEKPVFADHAPGDERGSGPTYVAYNLRFHPLVMRLREALRGRRTIQASLHVGQNLADWRPGRDYRVTYSASSTAGGGALRDLSHELDLALHLFGPVTRVAALGGNSGALGTAADDHGTLIAEHAGCPALSLSLNALDRPPRRGIVATTEQGTLTLDFIAGALSGPEGEIARVTLEKADMYRAEHEAALDGGRSPLCSYAEGLAALRYVLMAERAMAERRWVDAA